MSLTKDKIAQRLMKHPHPFRTKTQAISFVESFFEEIAKGIEDLKEEEKLSLLAFGKFETNRKNERPGRNPRTGEDKIISARRVVTFKPSLILSARINDKLRKDS